MHHAQCCDSLGLCSSEAAVRLYGEEAVFHVTGIGRDRLSLGYLTVGGGRKVKHLNEISSPLIPYLS